MKAWTAPIALAAMLAAAPALSQPAGGAGLFAGWNAKTHAALIVAGSQISEIVAPGAAPHPLSPETDVAIASWAPRKGDVLVVERGGQYYIHGDSGLALLTDGKSRATSPTWSHDGHWLAYTSNRDDPDEGLHIVDPRDAKSDRLVAQVKGSGWSVRDFTADGTSAVVAHRLSPTRTAFFFMDVASGAMRPIGKPAAYGDARFSYDGVLWATLAGRLGMIDFGSGLFTPVALDRNGIGAFDVSLDGKFVAYVAAGTLKLLDTRTGESRSVPAVPTGKIDDLHFAAGGALGFSVAGTDLYALDPATMAVTRWH